MKKILITGANSYIGISFSNYIKENYPNNYEVDTIDMLDSGWREKDFSSYDCVFHVAGIAHSDSGRISKKKAKLYYDVNTHLTIETASKAKNDGVKQFVFMSSAIVYGNSAPIGKTKIILKDTPVSPANCYGDSKVQAENGIMSLNEDGFRVVILRAPAVYGKGSKGNYPRLAKIAVKLPVFPYVDNKRSMIYIENLCEFVRLMIENGEQGIFWPQNSEYVNTSGLVKMIAAAHGKNMRLVKGFGWILKIISRVSDVVNKAFGNMTYDMDISKYAVNYIMAGLEDSVTKTEGGDNIHG